MLRAVERGLDKRDKTRIYKHVCMDEKSIRRGHEYVSMLYDGDTNKRIKWIENNLNNRPRKRLGYLTPNEKFKQIINMNSVAFGT